MAKNDNGNINIADKAAQDALKLAENTKKAQEAVKAVAQAAAGDWAGALKSGAKSGLLQVIAMVTAIFMLIICGFLSSVPSIIFGPLEKATESSKSFISAFWDFLQDPVNTIEGTALNEAYITISDAENNYLIDEYSTQIFNDTTPGKGIGGSGTTALNRVLGNISSFNGAVPSSLSSGSEIVLPDGKGDLHTVTYWDDIKWSKSLSTGKTIYALGGDISSVGGVAGGSITYQNGFVCYGDWYAVAMTSTFGNPGSMLFIMQDDGLVYPVMIADEASQVAFNNGYTYDDNPADKWGHNYGNQCCVTEFQLQKSSGAPSASTLQPRLACNIDKAIYVGSIYDGENSQKYINNAAQALTDLGITPNEYLDIFGNVTNGKPNPSSNANNTSNTTNKSITENVIFFGDSWMDNSTFSNTWGENNIIKAKGSMFANYFIGDNSQYPTDTEDVIEKVESAKGVFVQLGLNDWEFDSVAAGTKNANETYYNKMLDELGETYNDIPIFVGRAPNATKAYSSDLSNRIKVLNDFLKDYCSKNNGFYYVDAVADIHDGDGYLKSEYSDDSQFHLTAEGYKVWFDGIRKVLASGGVSGNGNGLANYNSSAFFNEDESATNSETLTLLLMFDKTKERYTERKNDLEKAIQDDYKKKQDADPNATMTISGGSSLSTYLDCARIVCLYNAQTNGKVAKDGFVDYLKWLGLEDTTGWFGWNTVTESEFSKKHEDDEGYTGYKESDWDDWDNDTPQRWQGDMLIQKDFDEVERLKADGKDVGIDDYIHTSALQELIYVEPEIIAEPVVITTVDDKGTEDTADDEETSITTTHYTYTIKTRSLDELAEFINLDYEQPAESTEKPKTDAYKDLYDITVKYFHIGNGSGGGNGGGNDIVRVALAEDGYLEKATNSQLDDPKANPGDGNYTKYGKWYGYNGVAWCNIFVSWCGNECGLLDTVIKKEAGCYNMYNWYNEKGLTYTKSDVLNGDKEPQPGDLVFRGPGDHIEIVEKYDKGSDELWTIGGNTSDNTDVVEAEGSGVYHKCYILSNCTFTHFASPEYPASGMNNAQTGNLCFAYESGSQTLGKYDVWMCHGELGDGAGCNYGAMSATQNGSAPGLLKYIKEHSTFFAEEFKGMNVGTAEFNNKWKNTAWTEEQTAEMEKLQREYVVEAFYNPIVADSELAWMNRSWALKEVIISRAVHRGVSGATGMLKKAPINANMTDDEVITAIYDYEYANLKVSGSESLTQALKNRMQKEVIDAKKFIGLTE